MDRISFGIGAILLMLGMGFLVVAHIIPSMHDPFVLGGLLWAAIGCITIIIDRSVNRKKQQMDALR